MELLEKHQHESRELKTGHFNISRRYFEITFSGYDNGYYSGDSLLGFGNA
jgi:hypothetical protein